MGESIFEEIESLLLGPQCAYRYSPDDTSHAVLFGGRGSLHSLLKFNQNHSICFEKVIILCFWARFKGPYFGGWDVYIYHARAAQTDTQLAITHLLIFGEVKASKSVVTVSSSVFSLIFSYMLPTI
jgi:hypothetical protein